MLARPTTQKRLGKKVGVEMILRTERRLFGAGPVRGNGAKRSRHTKLWQASGGWPPLNTIRVWNVTTGEQRQAHLLDARIWSRLWRSRRMASASSQACTIE